MTTTSSIRYKSAGLNGTLTFSKSLLCLAVLALLSVVLAPRTAQARTTKHRVSHRTVTVDGLSIFYREAGAPDAPTLLLLHGFPSSSRMYDELLVRLSDRYHLIAPDYPGFGNSDAPDPGTFAYTFDHLATVICCPREILHRPSDVAHNCSRIGSLALAASDPGVFWGCQKPKDLPCPCQPVERRNFSQVRVSGLICRLHNRSRSLKK